MMLQVILMKVRLMLWLRLMMDYVMILMNLMYLGLRVLLWLRIHWTWVNRLFTMTWSCESGMICIQMDGGMRDGHFLGRTIVFHVNGIFSQRCVTLGRIRCLRKVILQIWLGVNGLVLLHQSAVLLRD